MRVSWRRLLGKRREVPPVYVGSHEHKLSRLRPMHFDPDGERPTREDREAAQAERPEAQPEALQAAHRSETLLPAALSNSNARRPGRLS
jgi:hypothetical protein